MKSERNFAKAVIVSALLILAAPLYAITPLPWLHVEGNKIKDPNGNVIVLRGVDLIDLGSLEYWQGYWGGGASKMIDRITNKNDANGNSPGWYTKIVRIPIVPKDASDGTWPIEFDPCNLSDPNNAQLANLLRSVVNQCASNGVYSIIDWHYVANTYDCNFTTTTFWNYMAPKFANDSNVLFELFNEPINNTAGSDLNNWLSVRTNMQNWVNLVRSYEPNSIILVGGPSYCQVLAPQVTNPIDGNNIVYVSHIYPAHLLTYGSQDYMINQITTCVAAYPVMMTEWGFSQSGSPDPNNMLNGTIAGFGQFLSDFREQYGIGNTAWVASYNWGPPMFDYNSTTGVWSLRVGEGEMGGFTKDQLYILRNDDQPGMPSQSPYGGNAWPIPGTIEAENFDEGGPNVAYYDTTPYNNPAEYRDEQVDIEVCSEGGYDVTDTNAGEWLEYTVEVESTGIYNIDLRVAAVDSGGTCHILFGTTNVSGTVNIPSTGDGQTFTTVQIPNVPLKGGKQLMRFFIDTGGWNLNWIKFTKVVPTGTILREWWTGISGTTVSSLTSNVNYPNNPTGREMLIKLVGPTNWSDNYGTRIRGYLNPVADGDYTFWVASDDYSELWLSTDSNPANAVKIAYVTGYTKPYQWDKYDSQRSSQKSLLAGHKYYIQVLHKEGTGNDNVAVGWQGPAINQQMIDGKYLSPSLYPAFFDYAFFSKQWLRTDCTINNSWCNGADLNRDGSIPLEDLLSFVNDWLVGSQ